jgi:hypothetical protein
MDALALLCNLYGDGPATLRRLREAGVGELADLGRASLDDLATILGGSKTAARRFQSEAALLEARAIDAGERSTDEPTAVSAAHAHREPALERALAAWRAADAAAARGEDADDSPVAGLDAELDLRAASAGSFEETAPQAGTPLRPELVDGLDTSTCARLRAAGVEHAEELVTADLLELSATSEIALTRLMRIQGHVRRLVLAESPGLLVPHPRRADQRFSPDPFAEEVRERRHADSDSGSGPFA